MYIVCETYDGGRDILYSSVFVDYSKAVEYACARRRVRNRYWAVDIYNLDQTHVANIALPKVEYDYA